MRGIRRGGSEDDSCTCRYERLRKGEKKTQCVMVLHTVAKYFWYAKLRTKNYPNFMLFLGNVGKKDLQGSTPTLDALVRGSLK